MSDNGFKCLSKKFSGKVFKLVKQKGVCPYEYICSEDKLSYRCKCFSSLKDEVLVKRFIYILLTFGMHLFEMNTMGDYRDLCLKTDVLLLADVFEKYINTCLGYYGLDPCHYFSSPVLS